MPFLTLLLLVITAIASAHGAMTNEKSAVEVVSLESHAIKDPKLIIDYQLSSIDRLIEMTDRTIANLTALRLLIDDYKQKQEIFIEQPNDKEKLYKMAKSAAQILTQAKNDNLTDALDQEFLSEVTMLAQLYRKITLPSVP